MITIDRVLNGPPGAAHGGVIAGRAAELVDPRRAVVRLLAPVPLATGLVPVARPDGSVELRAGHAPVVAVSATGPLAVAPLPPIAPAAVVAAEAAWPGPGDHPFPTCWGCGTGRPDGLALRPGPVPGHALHASRWCPPGRGEVEPWVVWAALDCPSGAPAVAAAPGRRVVTGELAVDILGPVVAGAPHLIVSRATGHRGRRTFTEAVLRAGDGSTRAVATATWFALDGEGTP